jgi:magnesium-transporting ATPase (P-type)
MSQKSSITIVVGLLVFVAILVVSIFIFVATAASGPEIMASPQKQVEKLRLAETIQTTFIFIAVLELSITGVLAYQWRRSDIPHRPYTDEREENKRETTSMLVRFSVITGIIAFVTSYIASLLDVFVFEIYGGLNLLNLICAGIPAGLLGMLGGFIWRKGKKKSKFTPIDLFPLILIGIIAGIIPGACIKLLPQ